jgi:hypothetical protein
MKKILSFLILLSIFSIKTTCGQDLLLNPKTNVITVKKTANADLVIPIKVDFINQSAKAINPSVTLQIDKASAPAISQFTDLEFAKMKILNANQNISLNPNETKKPDNIFYLIIDKALEINFDKIIYLNFTEGARQLCNIIVNIQAYDKVLTLGNYMNEKKLGKREHRLDSVSKVELNNNILTISGFKEITVNSSTKNIFLKKNVELKRGEVYSVTEGSWVFHPYHWKSVPISIITVPFKVRPPISENGKFFDRSATSGITNFGFNLDLFEGQRDSYFSTGKKTTHKLSIGILATPSVEELDSVFTNGANGRLGKGPGKMEKSKQLFISTGVTISYSYNDISFVIVPYGLDYGTSAIGKTWVYHKQRWWGFGIAISPKAFATIFAK